jgi:hypothetical protein
MLAFSPSPPTLQVNPGTAFERVWAKSPAGDTSDPLILITDDFRGSGRNRTGARPVQERQAWEAAEVEPLRPASAVAQRVPVSLEPSVEAALAHRVQSVPLPAPQPRDCDRQWGIQRGGEWRHLGGTRSGRRLGGLVGELLCLSVGSSRRFARHGRSPAKGRRLTWDNWCFSTGIGRSATSAPQTEHFQGLRARMALYGDAPADLLKDGLPRGAQSCETAAKATSASDPSGATDQTVGSAADAPRVGRLS